MRLTAYTDYSLRTLIFLAMNREQLVTIQEIADAHGIAKNHLTKVVHQLGTLGYVETVRGRNGGLRLGKEPAAIRIGEVVRHTEPDFYMASCFDQASKGCMYSAACVLKGALGEATAAFLQVLDGMTLEQMVIKEERKRRGKEAVGAIKPVELHFKPKRQAA
ncbi:Rrf2 family transcriptional regulator [Massilia endophytica]|uniref:Rrf2 family transcriptional regulator n=1 Tax=Massilia endophytica TaxID=2899220 RepID=UPI001E534B32|nr:Rrf2 family transcriptional regulator [Massilia endophytica]UGQ46414.1 Rrf2 family transcriptional regulator [Massilia endophytica]